MAHRGFQQQNWSLGGVLLTKVKRKELPGIALLLPKGFADSCFNASKRALIQIIHGDCTDPLRSVRTITDFRGIDAVHPRNQQIYLIIHAHAHRKTPLFGKLLRIIIIATILRGMGNGFTNGFEGLSLKATGNDVKRRFGYRQWQQVFTSAWADVQLVIKSRCVHFTMDTQKYYSFK